MCGGAIQLPVVPALDFARFRRVLRFSLFGPARFRASVSREPLRGVCPLRRVLLFYHNMRVNRDASAAESNNLVLDELDRELERRGHRFVRYADDCNIYVRSERAGQRVMESITRFITIKLRLKVNEAKSAVARPQERKFLGFSFTAGPEVKRVIAPKALDRFKRRIREITRRAKSVSLKTTMEELAPYMRGWRSYFGFCETPEVLIGLTRWVRLRLRAALWRQWKTRRRRRAALLALGVRPRLASNTASSSLGPWYLAKAKALSVGLSNAYFKSLGLPSLFEEGLT